MIINGGRRVINQNLCMFPSLFQALVSYTPLPKRFLYCELGTVLDAGVVLL